MSHSTNSTTNAGRQYSPDQVEEFVKLLGENQRRLYIYLMTLMNDRSNVDDVLQETNLVIWREFETFELGTNFTAWACRIAYNQMLAWRKKQQRDRLQFSDAFLQAVSEELDVNSDYLEQRSKRLANCLERLPDHQRQLIRYRYTSGDAVAEIADRTKRSTDAVYRMLSRIRHILHECITRSLAQEAYNV